MQALPRFEEIVPDIFTPSVTVETPGYLHITVRINKSLEVRNVFWHLVDPSFSLLELGFEYLSHRLTAISVPLFKGRIGEAGYELPKCVRGEPLFDLKEMGFRPESKDIVPDVIKCEGRISVNRSGKDLDIILSDSRIEQALCCQNELIYGFSAERRLSLIRLRNCPINFPS